MKLLEDVENRVTYFESLYRESVVALPGTALRNQHINAVCRPIESMLPIAPPSCHDRRKADALPFFIPSRMYVFMLRETIGPVKWEVHDNQEMGPAGCALQFSVSGFVDITEVIRVWKEIYEKQSITDLSLHNMFWGETFNVLKLSNNLTSLRLVSCTLPPDACETIMQQVSESSALRVFVLFTVTDFSKVHSLNLTSHF